MPNKTLFRKDLEHIINSNSMESGSDTPDFILAEYLLGCLDIFDATMQAREKWYGRGKPDVIKVEPPASDPLDHPNKQTLCARCLGPLTPLNSYMLPNSSKVYCGNCYPFVKA